MHLRLSKLRPVGSRVYPPAPPPRQDWPWEGEWLSCFTPSGTAALAMAVALACQRKPRVEKPEAIIPAYGCPDLVAALVAQGVNPRLVDLAPDSPWMDLDLLSQALTSSTVAIVAVDFLGLSERLPQISKMAAERGLFLIEDSAQRFPPASLTTKNCDCIVLSFGRGKPINLMGGGLLLVQEAHRDALTRVLQGLPRLKTRYGLYQGLKRRLFNLLLRRWIYCWIERLPFLHLGETRYEPLSDYGLWEPPEELLAGGIESFAQRPDWAGSYDANLAKLEKLGWKCLSLKWPNARKEGVPLLRYPILAPDQATRDRALLALNARGIGANAFYGAALSETSGTAAHLVTEGAPVAFPQAERFAARLLTLPCHEDVTQGDIEQIGAILGELAEQ